MIYLLSIDKTISSVLVESRDIAVINAELRSNLDYNKKFNKFLMNSYGIF